METVKCRSKNLFHFLKVLLGVHSIVIGSPILSSRTKSSSEYCFLSFLRTLIDIKYFDGVYVSKYTISTVTSQSQVRILQQQWPNSFIAQQGKYF